MSDKTERRSRGNRAIAAALREFIVAEAGMDLGELTTDQAQRGADHIHKALKDQDMAIFTRMPSEPTKPGDDW